ncbi:hypothetical protein [Paracoccus sanguinis]|uniref:hypothetical protein n=1 Tax=Paracoccus sanguinis TaxID=1545044 RepID=UPI00051FC267|nr:hypothetical protein [Paracoccus sanguinis]KGJ13916.1 hypothetical protein IX54_09625 [Paracoccus sanguinis]
MIRAGGLTGRRATTFHEITAIGREARNCLRHSVRNDVRDEDLDIWVIRRGQQLVAVASVFRERMIMKCAALATRPVSLERDIGW